MKKVIFLISVLALVMLGCGQGVDEENAGIPNPASKFCIDHGGKSEIRTAQDGSQAGYCIIDGKECDEWALFRGECTEAHVCTDEENENIACTMDYNPVCGNDGQTYGNGCSACSAGIKSWTKGECRPSDCGMCPLIMPPSTDFCENGTIVAGEKDACGCAAPPTCVTA